MVQVERSTDGGRTFNPWRTMPASTATLLERGFPYIYRIVHGRLVDIPTADMPLRSPPSIFDKWSSR